MKKLALFVLICSVACSCASTKSASKDLGIGNILTDQDFPFDSIFAPERPKPVLEPKKGKNYYPLIKLTGEIDQNKASDIVYLIKEANDQKAKGIIMEIDSPGGSVPDGYDIVKAMEESEIPVKCVVDFEAASMAFYILQACQERVMTKRSVAMAHELRLSGLFSGLPNEWKAVAEMMAAMQEALIQHCIKKMNVTSEEFRERTDGGKQWWFSYKDALKYGAIDEAVDNVKQFINRYRN